MKKIDLTIIEEQFIGFYDAEGLKLLPDPFSQSSLMGVSRVKRDSKYLPLILAKSEHDLNHLMFFASHISDHVIQWNFDENLIFKSEESLSTDEFACFLTVYGFNLTCWFSDSIDEKFESIKRKFEKIIFTISLKLPEKISEDFKYISELSGCWSDLRFFEKNYKANHYELCNEISDLIDKDLCDPEIFNFFKRFVTEGSSDRFAIVGNRGEVLVKPGTQPFIAALINAWKFTCLREIFYLLNGRYLCYSPFSGKWVLSEKTICSIAGVRFSLFKDGAIEFFEFSGRGFVSPVNGYLVPVLNNQLIIIDRKSSPSSWFNIGSADIAMVTAAVAAVKSAPFDSFSDEKYIISNVHQNLGHFLWNDFSGIFYINKICNELSLKKPSVAIFKKNLTRQSAFSDLSISQVTLDILKASDESSPCLFDQSHDIDFIKTGSFILLKSLFMSNELISYYNNFFTNVLLPEPTSLRHDKKYRVLINVRSHNKSLLNIKACFSELLAQMNSAGFTGVEFLLEGDSQAEDLIRDLCGIAVGYGFNCTILLKYNIYKLHAILRDVDFVVAPVGSGLVSPTWLLNKPCITYAEPHHLSQLSWWNMVVDKKLKINSFTNDDIEPVTDKMYASYTINPVIFARKTFASIRNYCA